MRTVLRRVLLKTLAALVALAGCMPILSLACAQPLAGRETLWFALPSGGLMIALAASFIPRRKTRLIVFLPAALGYTACWGVNLHGLGAWAIAAVAMTAVMAFMLMPALRRPEGDELRPNFLLGALMAGLIAWFLLRADAFSGARNAMRISLVAYLLLVPFYVNYARVVSFSQAGKKPPRDVTVRNRVMVAVVCVLAAIFSLWQTLGEWLSAAWEAIKRAFFAVVAFIMSLLPDMSAPMDPTQEAPEAMDLGMLEQEAEAASSPIVEIIVRLVAMLALALALVLLLIKLSKWARLFYGFLRDRIGKYGGGDGAYEDETESIFNLSETTRAMRDKLTALRERHARPPRWESMTPRERVRFLYKQYLKKHPDVKTSATARETLGDACAVTPTYEAARYSAHEITEAQAEDARRDISAL